MLQLVSFLSPAERLRESTHDWKRLQSVATILGGSDDIDAAYKQQDLHWYNPSIPSEDFQDKYDWRTVDEEFVSHRETSEKILELEEQGFVFASAIVKPSHKSSMINRFRRRKET